MFYETVVRVNNSRSVKLETTMVFLRNIQRSRNGTTQHTKNSQPAVSDRNVIQFANPIVWNGRVKLPHQVGGHEVPNPSSLLLFLKLVSVLVSPHTDTSSE